MTKRKKAKTGYCKTCGLSMNGYTREEEDDILRASKECDESDPFSSENLKANLEMCNDLTVRDKGQKTDAELFAEWEEKTNAGNIYCCCLDRECRHIRANKERKATIAAIAKELGPKLAEMRLEKLETRLRKLENPTKTGIGNKGQLFYDGGPLTEFMPEKNPWWKSNFMRKWAEYFLVVAVARITFYLFGWHW